MERVLVDEGDGLLVRANGQSSNHDVIEDDRLLRALESARLSPSVRKVSIAIAALLNRTDNPQGVDRELSSRAGRLRMPSPSLAMRIRRPTVAISTCLLLIACLGAARPDRRIVDRVTIGDVGSEQDHAYGGVEVSSGVSEGRVFRETRGWLRYGLAIFDDTEVTVAFTFLGAQAPRTFDFIIDNQVVSTYTFRSGSTTTVELRVPLALTKGKTNILVTLRATSGPTPALLGLRSVQDHNE